MRKLRNSKEFYEIQTAIIELATAFNALSEKVTKFDDMFGGVLFEKMQTKDYKPEEKK